MKNLRTNTASFVAFYWNKLVKELREGCFISIVLLVILIATPYIDLYIGLTRIGMKTGIRPTVSALQLYLDRALTPGMPRDKVYEMFSSLGTKVKVRNFSSEGDVCDAIGLYIGYWPLNRLEYSICYDKELHLKSVDLDDKS